MNAAATVLLGALEGTRMTAAETRWLSKDGPSGLTLFKRNVTADFSRELSALNAAAQHCRPAGAPQLIIAVDQEGGRVSRIPAPFPNLGPAMTLFTDLSGPAAATALTQYGSLVGAALKALGINTNFAPVADILTRPTNDAIGDRAFGLDAATVTARAGAFLQGLQSAGVAGCLKHFPGQGDAGADTHYQGATIAVDRAALWDRELAPFRALAVGTPMVMVSHCIFSAYDEDKPASLSSRIMTDLLRKELGYRGLIVSDDMNMAAIVQDDQAWCEALAASLVAGADLLLVCRHLERIERASEYFHAESQRSSAFAAVLYDRATRVYSWRKRLG